MSIADELATEVSKIFRDSWDERKAQDVPSPESLKLGNDAACLERATVLYADLDGSTNMVDNYSWQIAAEIYKSYLHCAAKLIRSHGGTITSYDGDRVMGIFVGDSQTSQAARCALKINHAVKKIINPAFKAQYGDRAFEVKQSVGIDVSPLRAARTGIRGNNDIVWVGRAANYAAKLTSAGPQCATWITGEGFDRLADDAKFGGNPRRLMWTEFAWTPMNRMRIYGSIWTWKP